MFLQNVADNFWIKLLKGVIVSIIVSLVLVLVFSLGLYLFGGGKTATAVCSCIVRIIGVGVTCFMAIGVNRGMFKGAVCGLVSGISLYLLFAAFGGDFTFGINHLLNIVFAIICGVIFGIISVNLKKG